MALKRDLSSLPTAATPNPDACPPDAEPTFLRPYFDHLRALDAADGERPHAVAGTRFRHSMAGSCARAVAYHALDVPESDPMDMAGIVVTRDGTEKHDAIQAVLVAYYGDALEIEVPCQIVGFDGSGTADGFLAPHGRPSICWEHKNPGGWGFKAARGERSPAEGPKIDHLTQGALNALALDADLLVITYLSKEAVSVQMAQRKGIDELGRIAAQWTFTRDQWEPIARAEVARVSGILSLLDEGQLPARKIPGTPGVIVDPATARWEQRDADGVLLDTGATWNCHYCRWQTMCARTPAERFPVETLVEITSGRHLTAVPT